MNDIDAGRRVFSEHRDAVRETFIFAHLAARGLRGRDIPRSFTPDIKDANGQVNVWLNEQPMVAGRSPRDRWVFVALDRFNYFQDRRLDFETGGQRAAEPVATWSPQHHRRRLSYRPGLNRQVIFEADSTARLPR